jgi:hypothetical protein
MLNPPSLFHYAWRAFKLVLNKRTVVFLLHTFKNTHKHSHALTIHALMHTSTRSLTFLRTHLADSRHSVLPLIVLIMFLFHLLYQATSIHLYCPLFFLRFYLFSVFSTKIFIFIRFHVCNVLSNLNIYVHLTLCMPCQLKGRESRHLQSKKHNS